MEQLFIKDINLARIANICSQDDINNELRIVLDKFNNSKFQHELLAIRNPNLYGLNILNPIIKEICDNLLIGNNYAAIALTNILFEATIKFTLIFLNTDPNATSFDKIHSEAIKKFDDNILEQNINACKSRGYIAKEDGKRLTELAKVFRNPFSHASFSKKISDITNDGMMKFGRAPINKLSEIEFNDVKIADMPIFYMSYLQKYVDINAIGYFGTIMYYVDKFDLMINERNEDACKK